MIFAEIACLAVQPQPEIRREYIRFTELDPVDTRFAVVEVNSNSEA